MGVKAVCLSSDQEVISQVPLARANGYNAVRLFAPLWWGSKDKAALLRAVDDSGLEPFWILSESDPSKGDVHVGPTGKDLGPWCRRAADFVKESRAKRVGLWNEPNETNPGNGFWKGSGVSEFCAFALAASDAVLAASPGVSLWMAGLSRPLDPSTLEYALRMRDAGVLARGGLSLHPYRGSATATATAFLAASMYSPDLFPGVELQFSEYGFADVGAGAAIPFVASVQGVNLARSAPVTNAYTASVETTGNTATTTRAGDVTTITTTTEPAHYYAKGSTGNGYRSVTFPDVAASVPCVVKVGTRDSEGLEVLVGPAGGPLRATVYAYNYGPKTFEWAMVIPPGVTVTLTGRPTVEDPGLTTEAYRAYSIMEREAQMSGAWDKAARLGVRGGVYRYALKNNVAVDAGMFRTFGLLDAAGKEKATLAGMLSSGAAL